MEYKWLDNYLLSKNNAVKEWHKDFEAFRYLIADKMFAMIGKEKNIKPIITLKLIPSNGLQLREKYKDDIKAGYYMNKTHWNSLYLEGSVPDDVLKKMIDESYSIIFNSLSKKKQEELLAKTDK